MHPTQSQKIENQSKMKILIPQTFYVCLWSMVQWLCSILAKPVKTVELHYPMTQFLIIRIICPCVSLCATYPFAP